MRNCRAGFGVVDRSWRCIAMPGTVRALMRVAAVTAIIAILTACQADLGGKASEAISPTRLEYVNEFRKIDTAGKGRITIEQATAYYSNRFTELDRNGDGFLDAQELEPLIPVMNARSGRELLFKLDRNSDNKLSRSEFLVIVNWLFQLASSGNELALGDVEKNLPATVPVAAKPEANPSPSPTIPTGKGRY
jgi:Ca2+-binding EF-hand superfamily protein